MGRDQKQLFPVCASSRQLSLTLRISQAGGLTIGDLTWNQNAYVMEISPPCQYSLLPSIPLPHPPRQFVRLSHARQSTSAGLTAGPHPGRGGPLFRHHSVTPSHRWLLSHWD